MKSRKVDDDFQKMIDSDRVYTCEKHFAPDDIEICKYNSATVVFVVVFPQWKHHCTLKFLYFLLIKSSIRFSCGCENDQKKTKVWCFTDFKYASKKPSKSKTCTMKTFIDRLRSADRKEEQSVL